MCSACMVQLLSLSPTPTLTYVVLCHQDSAIRLCLSGELDREAAGLKEERGLLFQVPSRFGQPHRSSGS